MNLTEICHKKIYEWVSNKKNIFSIDATCGNGNDTLFLSKISKTVFSFDIQNIAIDRSKKLLVDNNLQSNVLFFNESHSDLLKFIPNDKINIVMYNLGWLPKSDKSCVTKAETTLQSLTSLKKILAKENIVSVLSYRGHDGGNDEFIAVENFLSDKNFQRFEDKLNPKSPVLFLFSL